MSEEVALNNLINDIETLVYTYVDQTQQTEVIEFLENAFSEEGRIYDYALELNGNGNNGKTTFIRKLQNFYPDHITLMPYGISPVEVRDGVNLLVVAEVPNQADKNQYAKYLLDAKDRSYNVILQSTGLDNRHIKVINFPHKFNENRL